MRKQIMGALVGMVLAAIVFLGGQAKASERFGQCADGWSSLDISCRFFSCDYVVVMGEPVATGCTYYCTRMSNVVPVGMEICDNRESPKPTEPADDRKNPVNNSRSDSR